MALDHRSELHGEFGEDSEGSFGLYIVGRIEFGELCKVIRRSHCMCELSGIVFGRCFARVDHYDGVETTSLVDLGSPM
jgi:hypothetical protein